MNMIETKFRGRIGLLASLGLLSLGQASHAHADTTVLSSSKAFTEMVQGTGSTTYSFDAPSAGILTAQLTNWSWPDPLSALSFAETTASNALSSWSATDTSQSQSFQVTPGTYFTHINATAGGALDVGLYTLALTFQPLNAVPLPASGWMLLIGLSALFGLARVTSGWRPFETLAPRSA
jgi:hypothetical protein